MEVDKGSRDAWRTVSKGEPRAAWVRMLAAAAQAYGLSLLAWLALHLAFGDRWPWLFVLNSFAAYWFAPLPLALAAAVIVRRPVLWAQVVIGLGAWAWMFGGLFWPPFPAAHAGGQSLRVMTWNVLGYNQDLQGIVAAIRSANADVVAIQELSPALAQVVQAELGQEYPYQVLDPQRGVGGGGVISRYPLQPTGETLPGRWLGRPQVLRLEFEQRSLTLVRFHTNSSFRAIEERAQAAEALAEYGRSHPGPLILTGDLNATGQSEAHAIVTRQYVDAWEAAGWGLGHTFPGAASPGSSRPRVLGVPVPKWLVRIDFVFYSRDLTAIAAQVGPWDGVSDHRGVVVDLALGNQTFP